MNNSPRYYPFEDCEDVLIPGNLLVEKKITVKYVTDLQKLGIEIMIDSGAAHYYLRTTREYPENYLEEYLQVLEKIKPAHAFALDFCFEKKKFRNYKKLKANFESQLESIQVARKRKIELYPVVQGWDRDSYVRSAREVANIRYDRQTFGIGSICTAKLPYIQQVIRWVKGVLPVRYAHAFGQTQRIVKELKKHRFASMDTSNATGNAKSRLYCDPFGKNFYSPGSKQGKRKHCWYEEQFENKKQMYGFFFTLNREALDYASREVPADWIHPLHNNRLDNYIVGGV